MINLNSYDGFVLDRFGPMVWFGSKSAWFPTTRGIFLLIKQRCRHTMAAWTQPFISIGWNHLYPSVIGGGGGGVGVWVMEQKADIDLKTTAQAAQQANPRKLAISWQHQWPTFLLTCCHCWRLHCPHTVLLLLGILVVHFPPSGLWKLGICCWWVKDHSFHM